MLGLPWSVVTQLRVEPVGPVKASVFGWRWVATEPTETAMYRIIDLPRARQTRDLLGGMVYDQRMKNLSPWYVMLCELQRGLQE